MQYFLLTGATGLLGRYLLRDLTLAELPLAVVVRPTRWESAAQRIETAMARWEDELGRSLVRPVVLQGDIAQPGLGLSARDRDWAGEKCHAMIHSAASLSFQADEATGEPWRSNVAGTRHVIELCGRLGIRQLHHVSTAYVCGLRRGRILESELNVGQELGNAYESSKLTAESEVISSSFDRVTVYRPAIIVGDSKTGFTTSYHGFYTPLRLVYSLLQSVPWETILRRDWLGQLGLSGDERKNLVSVDWVAAAMSYLLAHSECHGRTYHLTNPIPATTRSMREAMTEVLAELAAGQQPPQPPVNDDYLDAFRDQMGVYRSYWSDDPEFDSTNTQAAVGHLPCPEIDHEVMNRLVRFAIGSNFGWPREAAVVPAYWVGEQLLPWVNPPRGGAHPGRPSGWVDLYVTGPGGGQWHVNVEQGKVIEAGPGLQGRGAATCYLASSTFAELMRGHLAPEDAIHTGRLVVTGNSPHPYELARLFGDLASRDQGNTETLQRVTIG